MSTAPPFIYDKPSTYTFGGPTQRGFNPKAATQASWTPPPQRPKQTGPLIDFNKHPDSYLIVPYGNLNVEPMHPKTKTRVKRARIGQLLLRLCAFLGALGLLFCIIAINKTSTSVGWIIRVGPAIALCHTVYAIYHLCRDSTSRSPGSSASYMLFAAMIDTGLIPFFGISAVMAYQDWNANAYGWSTLFGETEISYKVIYAFFILSLSEAGILAVSLLLDLYLAIIFRKIAKMPPDMNPLEDNLTARPNGRRHKRNKSEMTFEKHLSGSTLSSQRLSQIKEVDAGSTKRVPFMHTRTDSGDRITLYGNETAYNSRVSLRNELKEAQADPYRSSIASSHDTLIPSRPSSAITPAANARAPGAGLTHKPVRSSGLAPYAPHERSDSWLSYRDSNGNPTSLSNAANRQLDDEVRPLSPVSMMSDREQSPERIQTERQNWYTGSVRQSQSGMQHNDVVNFVANNGSLSPQASPSHPKKRSRDPLGMNPPTPVRTIFGDENTGSWNHGTEAQNATSPHRQALQNVHGNSPGRPSMGSRPSSFVGSGGKARFYGNLRTSIGGSPTRSSRPEYPQQHEEDDYDDDKHSVYSRTRTMESDDSANFRVYESDGDEAPRYNPHNSNIMYDSDEDNDVTHTRNETRINELRQRANEIMLGPSTAKQYQQEDRNDTRKTSNSTGYDLRGGYAGLGADFGLGMARRREVSGKVAEEGRGGTDAAGYGGIGRSEQLDGGVITGQGTRGGAAGWARFKGL